VKPAWAIKANGKDVTAAFKPYLVSIRVRDESKDEADTCTITLTNRDAELVPPVQGDDLEVLLGYEGNLRSVGTFSVDETSVSGPPDQMVIACKSAAFATRGGDGGVIQSWLVVKTRSWEPATIGDLARKIAAEHSVELVAPADVLSAVTPHLDQTEESDTGFLYRLVEPRGYFVKVASKQLIIARSSAGLTSSVKTGEALPTVEISKGQVSSYSAKWQDRSVYTKVTVSWHDAATGQARYETAGTGSRELRAKNPAPDQKTAQEQAAAILRKSQGQGGKMTLTMPGRTDVQAEQLVICNGFPYPLSTAPTKGAVAKQWVLKSVEHTLTLSGFTTSVDGEPYLDK
jgi:phage protein D